MALWGLTMTRSKNEIIERERYLIESINGSREVMKIAKDEKNPCLNEALEWLTAIEKQLQILTQFRDATRQRIENALAETEKSFLSDLAEVLCCNKECTEINFEKNDEVEKIISPVIAYIEGKPKLPASANEARKRAHLLWHIKYILEWLLKTS